MNIDLEKEENNIEKSFFSIFFTTFTTIFIAELGDKTQLATLMLSAESGKPLIVFIGKWLSKKISPSRFAFFTGLLMIFISLFLGYDIIRNYLK